MTLFRRKFRIESARRPGFDYATTGHYFFTICIKNRHPVFGSVYQKKMLLSLSGKLAWECWRKIPYHYPGVRLGSFIVMPDHVHGIIILSDQYTNIEENPKLMGATGRIPTLGNVIGSFKSAVTKKIHETGYPGFRWLPRYHDHIIRDEHERILIERYIPNNPRRWRDPSS